METKTIKGNLSSALILNTAKNEHKLYWVRLSGRDKNGKLVSTIANYQPHEWKQMQANERRYFNGKPWWKTIGGIWSDMRILHDPSLNPKK